MYQSVSCIPVNRNIHINLAQSVQPKWPCSVSAFCAFSASEPTLTDLLKGKKMDNQRPGPLLPTMQCMSQAGDSPLRESGPM